MSTASRSILLCWFVDLCILITRCAVQQLLSIRYTMIFQKYVFPSLLIFLEAADLLQKLSLDSQTKTLEIPEPTKKVLYMVLVVYCIH